MYFFSNYSLIQKPYIFYLNTYIFIFVGKFHVYRFVLFITNHVVLSYSKFRLFITPYFPYYLFNMMHICRSYR